MACSCCSPCGRPRWRRSATAPPAWADASGSSKASWFTRGPFRSRGRLEGEPGPVDEVATHFPERCHPWPVTNGCPGGARVGLCAAVRMLSRMSPAGAAGAFRGVNPGSQGPGAVPLAAGASASASAAEVKSIRGVRGVVARGCARSSGWLYESTSGSGHRSFAWLRLGGVNVASPARETAKGETESRRRRGECLRRGAGRALAGSSSEERRSGS